MTLHPADPVSILQPDDGFCQGLGYLTYITFAKYT
jgi:hypothetical protein